MYSIDVFILIAGTDMVLSAYSVIGKGADYYKDLVAIIFACFISVYLGLVVVSGTVINYDGSFMSDDGLMWGLFIIALIQGIFALMEIVEAYEEHIQGKYDQGNLIS